MRKQLQYSLLYYTTSLSLTHTIHFNDHFPVKPGLASFTLDFQYPMIHIISFLM